MSLCSLALEGRGGEKAKPLDLIASPGYIPFQSQLGANMELWQAAVAGSGAGVHRVFCPSVPRGIWSWGQRLLGFTEPALMFDICRARGQPGGGGGRVLARPVGAFLRGLFVWDDEQSSQGRRLLWLVVVGSIPTAIIGFAFKDLFESMFLLPAHRGFGPVDHRVAAFGHGPGAPSGPPPEKRWARGRALLIGLAPGFGHHPGHQPLGQHHFHRPVVGSETAGWPPTTPS